MSERQNLQRLIDNAAKAHSEAWHASQLLCEECLKQYGYEPGDVDADAIIDAVLGGCGNTAGMSATEFDQIMRECISRYRP